MKSREVFKHRNQPLFGTVDIDGGKHGFSHDMPVAALADEGTLTNVPNIIDAQTLINALKLLFAHVEYDKQTYILTFSSPVKPKEIFMSDELLSRSRSLFGFLPAMLHRGHTIKMEGLPAGCNMGDRPTDWYFDVLKQFGVNVEASEKEIILTWEQRKPADIQFEYPTMTGTVIAIAAAAVVNGTSTISNGSVEPSCIEEINCAASMGVEFSGELPELSITGKSSYSAIQWEVLHDRVHAVTYLTAGLLTRGTVTVRSHKNLWIPAFVDFLKQAGVEVENNGNEITARFPERGYLNPVHLDTGSEPLFSSDWMATTVLLLAARSKGTSIVTDNVFPDRLQCLTNLEKIGLRNVKVEKTEIDGRKALYATIDGNPDLVLDGGEVGECTDLRGSTALAMAALISDQDIIVANDFHLRRGYEDYEAVIDELAVASNKLQEAIR